MRAMACLTRPIARLNSTVFTIRVVTMEIYQLRTFVTVAREGSITRASELLFTSQPAVSAHIKALEEELDLVLFERTPRGMSLTRNGLRLLGKAEQLLNLQRDFIAEAKRIKNQLGGSLRLGSNREPSAQVLGKALARLSETCPALEITLSYGNSIEIAQAVRKGTLDAGLYIDGGEADAALEKFAVGGFDIHLAAPPGWVADTANPDWPSLARLPWLCPATSSCCGRAAELLFAQHGFRPEKPISVDQENVTRTLIAGGVGIGLLHADTAHEAAAKGEVELLNVALQRARLVFAYQKERAQDPMLAAVAAAVTDVTGTTSG